MSLKDIIEGAKEEAQANASSLPAKKGDKGEEGADEGEKRQGFVKRSAANAKPVREAASSVRMESKPRSADPLKSETKEEKKARRARERSEEDLRSRGMDAIMKSLPGYKKVDRVFWALLITGMAFAVVTLIYSWAMGDASYDASTASGVVMIVLLALSYVAIIAGMIYDFRKRRPFRREAEARVRSMTTKKLTEYMAEYDAAEAARKAAKKAGN